MKKQLKGNFPAKALVAALFVPAAALSQTSPTRPGQTSSGTEPEQGGGLQDIVVTAQRRSENLQRVPIAVTAISGSALTAAGITTTQQLNTVAPSLNIRTTLGSFQPSIRGIGTSSNVVENPVSLYIDGVYLPQQREGIRDLNDIAQIAVLKGPQGTLFGRNATGGVIQITTRAPTHDFRAEVGAELDNYATAKGDVYVTGGLTNTVALSISAQYAHQGEGWGTDYATGNDTYRLRHQFAVRSKLLFEPGPGTSVLLIADYLDRDELGASRRPYPGTSFSYPGVGPLKSVYDSYGGVDSTLRFKGGGVSLTINQDLSFAKLVSISSYRDGRSQYVFDNGAVPQPYFVVRLIDGPTKSYSQELQLVSKADGPIKWVLGTYYFHSDNSASPLVRNTAGPLAPNPTSNAVNTTVAKEVAESVAPFGQLTWEFLPRTRLTVGARYTYEKRSFDGTNVVQRNNGSIVTTGRNETTTVKKPTFRIALDNQITEDALIYASFNTGIKSGGFNILNTGNPGYLPEKLNAYEVGIKSQFANRRVRLNVAGFYYDYTNLQVIQFVSGIQTIVNGAAAKLYGLDADLEAELAPGLMATGGLALEHAKFTDYPSAVFGTQIPTGGAIISSGNAAGKRLPLAQKITATLALNYHHELARGALDFNITTNYNGDYYFEPDNFLRQKPYWMINTSLKWTAPGGHFSIMVWAKNLADEKVISLASTQSQGYPTSYGNAPRTFGITGRVVF